VQLTILAGPAKDSAAGGSAHTQHGLGVAHGERAFALVHIAVLDIRYEPVRRPSGVIHTSAPSYNMFRELFRSHRRSGSYGNVYTKLQADAEATSSALEKKLGEVTGEVAAALQGKLNSEAEFLPWRSHMLGVSPFSRSIRHNH